MSVPALFMIEFSNSGFAAAALLGFVLSTAVLYFLFRFLKKSVRMAFRMAVVAAFFFIFTVGGVALWWFGSGLLGDTKPTPASQRKR